LYTGVDKGLKQCSGDKKKREQETDLFPLCARGLASGLALLLGLLFLVFLVLDLL
jgi:hypothetical protein